MSPSYNISHRLYLNIDSDVIHKVVTELFNKCYEYGILYEFKFSEAADRGDSLVIYCSNDNLLLFVKLLELIKKEHPELEDKFHKPPIFTGVYDGWIGYGEEYKNANSSYNKDRCDIIEERLNGHFNNWRSRASNSHIVLNGKSVDIIEYLVQMLTEEAFLQQRSQYKYRSKHDSTRAKGRIELLDDIKYKEQVTSIIRAFLIKNKNKIFSLEELSNDSCVIPDIFGEKSRIYISQVKRLLKKIFVNSVKNNNKVLEFFRDDFKMEFSRHDLSERVVVSNETLRKLLNYQKKRIEGHYVVASRKADNRKLYKSILNVFEEISLIIKNNIGNKNIDLLIKPYMDKYFALKNALDKVKIYGFSGSSIDEDERAQYYICMMHQSLDSLNIKDYEYYRNMTLAYEDILNGAKRL